MTTTATPQPQREHCDQQYWLINEAELNELALYFREHKYPHIAKRGGAIISQVSTRPHTPAPEKVFVRRNGIPRGVNGIQGFDGFDYDNPFNVHSPSYLEEVDLKDHDAATARTATLATLDKLTKLIDSDNCPLPRGLPCPDELDCEHCCIQFLRQSTTAQEPRP